MMKIIGIMILADLLVILDLIFLKVVIVSGDRILGAECFLTFLQLLDFVFVSPWLFISHYRTYLKKI